ncbi:amino acid/amide ABC transporter ATP-binding protein 2, HAAT family [Desulfacinum infernum DSM 9756]|uniref:Amino acid/amide ABC transporter ATP-binding protein 2, HAAT family n=1 Tax=Desulfacinum infernum DSM 9756 TaxID=1121391 RepID=A0A1M5FQ13_9BACT|nr:ABC transporter ATP-binding protein [Desulfacinum infernum]SHF93261.1 amino acid/amide ABC transporter ATP-binding protein 2, HAAT family [Desulfacinum infernum DSM 9756]
MLEVKDLHVRYGNIQALHGISFTVKEGEMVALLGANGAGKTTTLLSIMRLPPPEAPLVTKGSILYKGVDLIGVPPHEVVSRHGIGLVPEGRHIFGNLTVMENLKIATYARKDPANIQRDYERVFGLFPRLADRKNQRADTLSGGEQQMLAMGRAFMSGVGFILLDEPSMGLSPLLMQELFRVLKELNEAGTTILVVEQNAHLALRYAHRAYVMETGRIVMEGPAQELAENPEIKKAYLG